MIKAKILLAAATLVLGCEFFVGESDQATVGIDLTEFFGEARATSAPAGIAFTQIVATIFGPGMTPITKTVSPGARYLNLYVPAGSDRHFRVEAFFTVVDEQVFIPSHLRSVIGRAKADLLPGKFVGLKFRMAAGASLFFVPDYNSGVIHYTPSLSTFDGDWITVLGAGQGIGPLDLEISARGIIFAANYTPTDNVINYASNIYGSFAGTIPAGGRVFALAMDRNAGYDINVDQETDLSVLYFSLATGELYFSVVDGTPTPPLPLNLEGRITLITGLAVDPWSHRLFITGTCDGAVGLIVYDPFYRVMDVRGGYVYGRILSVKTDPNFRTLFDVTVTDTAVYVLNAHLSTDTVPSVIQFDHGLNFVRGFGLPSWNGSAIVPSTAPGKFYIPVRFFAHENGGVFILDDSNVMDITGKADFDKVVGLNLNLDASSWQTYPAQQPDAGGYTTENFRFLY